MPRPLSGAPGGVGSGIAAARGSTSSIREWIVQIREEAVRRLDHVGCRCGAHRDRDDPQSGSAVPAEGRRDLNSKAEDKQARVDLRVGGLSGETRLKGGVDVRITQRPPV